MSAVARAIGTLSRITEELEAVLVALDRHVVLGTTPAADEVRRQAERLATTRDFADDLRCGLDSLLDGLEQPPN